MSDNFLFLKEGKGSPAAKEKAERLVLLETSVDDLSQRVNALEKRSGSTIPNIIKDNLSSMVTGSGTESSAAAGSPAVDSGGPEKKSKK